MYNNDVRNEVHIMTTMRIPEWNIDKFNKRIKSLERKGAKFDIEDLGMDVVKVDDVNYRVHIYNVDNKTVYAVPGWEFVGTIEHADPQNIIRTVSDEFFKEIPNKYHTCGPECEHCNKVRDRKDTYLVRNTETGEFKQVGRACLKSYTGLNPTDCTWSLNLERSLESLELDEDVVRADASGFSRFIGYDTKRVIALGIPLINAEGYKSAEYYVNSTKEQVRKLYDDMKAAVASDKEVDEFIDWVKKQENSDAYVTNSKIACQLEYCSYRDFGYILSFINYRNRVIEREREEQRRAELLAKSEFAGLVGQKILFTVKECRVLYTKDPYVYCGDCTYVYRLVDENDHVLIWSTTNDNVEVGVTIGATIKSLGEYSGEKQTTITRGKIVSRPKKDYDDSAEKAFEELYDYFESEEM